MSIRDNIQSIRSGIGPSVTIIAVTKTIGIPQIAEAVEAGITGIGESRVQEAQTKIPELKKRFPDLRFHMIGHLQKNKVKQALPLFDVIQSVDSVELAEEISKRAEKPVEIFLEVNTSGEESKYGIAPDKVMAVAAAAVRLPNLKVTGLMTIGPLTSDENRVRECFRELRELRDALKAAGDGGISHLSMGMSGDYALAIAEGSDIIRLGRAIFKPGG